MKNFDRLARSVDVDAILAEIETDPTAWNAQSGRQQVAPAQRETASIPLRGLRRSRIRGRRRRDVHESRYTSLSRDFPATVAFLECFAAANDAELGRAKLARLPAGARVHPHSDRGAYYRARDRYHLVLRSPSGSPLRGDGECVRMRERELWWFDNKSVHDAWNDSQSDRLHLIFDLRPRDGSQLRSRRSSNDDVAIDLGRAIADADETVRSHADTADGDADTAHRAEGRLVAACASLYLAGCRRPNEWASLLDRRCIAEDRDRRPLRALASAVLGDRPTAETRALARAVGWALSELDDDRLLVADVAKAVAERGGIAPVAREWRERRRPAQ